MVIFCPQQSSVAFIVLCGTKNIFVNNLSIVWSKPWYILKSIINKSIHSFFKAISKSFFSSKCSPSEFCINHCNLLIKTNDTNSNRTSLISFSELICCLYSLRESSFRATSSAFPLSQYQQEDHFQILLMSAVHPPTISLFSICSISVCTLSISQVGPINKAFPGIRIFPPLHSLKHYLSCCTHLFSFLFGNIIWQNVGHVV